MFERLGRLVPRLRLVFIAIWIVGAGLSLLAPSLSNVGSADETSFLPHDAESLTARNVIAQAFPSQSSATQARIVFERTSGLTDADRAYIDGLGGSINGSKIAGVERYTSARQTTQPGLTSPDGQLEMALVDLNVPAFQTKANDAIDAIRAVLQKGPPGLTAQVTGQAGIGRDYMGAIREGTDRTTVVTVVLVVVILLLIYRAPLAALVPLITIGMAFVVSRGILGVLGQAGWQLSSILDSFIVVLVFGVGTDYTIFLISRFREELAVAPAAEAIRATVGRIGAVIAASAATVIVGLSAMVVARFGMIQTTGPALALTIFVTLVAGLTLTPSLLSLLNRWLFWPTHSHRKLDPDASTGVWASIARGIAGHSKVVSTLVLLALAAPLLALPQLKQSFDVPHELPAGADSRLGFETLAKHLGAGQLLPITVLVKAPNGDLTDEAELRNISQVRDRIAGLAGVASVRSVVDLRPKVELPAFASSFAKAPSGDLNVQLGDASLAGLETTEQYVAGLGSPFPEVLSTTPFTRSTADLATLRQGLIATRAQALVSNQLNGIADRLQLASTAPSAAGAEQLTSLRSYLDELGAAYPDAASVPAYQTAQQALPQVAATRDATSYVQLVQALRDLATWFAARPTKAYFSPKSSTPSADAVKTQAAMAAARQRLPGELNELAALFSDINVYSPPPPSTPADGIPPTDLRGAFFSASGDVTQLFVTTKTDPYQTQAFDTVHQIRTLLAQYRAEFGSAAQVYVGGSTAEYADIQTTMSEDFLVVAAVTVAGILIVLVLLLRALIAPIYLVATVLLSYLTSLSLSALILQQGLGQPGLNYFIPLMVFVLLVALGSDYNIFLMARVREEAASRGLRPGIRVASARTGTVITSAGLILAGTFGALVTSPLQLLFQVGVAVALGVLIDTFVVRSLLVPALTTVVGPPAWWPSRLGMGHEKEPAGGVAVARTPAVEPVEPVKPVEPVEPSPAPAFASAPALASAPVPVSSLDGRRPGPRLPAEPPVRSRSLIGGAVGAVVGSLRRRSQR